MGKYDCGYDYDYDCGYEECCGGQKDCCDKEVIYPPKCVKRWCEEYRVYTYCTKKRIPCPRKKRKCCCNCCCGCKKDYYDC